MRSPSTPHSNLSMTLSRDYAAFATTEFEMQVARLGLTKESCIASEELRSWCERNKNRCYIPEGLLKVWGLTVDSNSGP